jgi:arylsulfatase
MMEHDRMIGELLDDMAEMGVLDNTIIIYSTDNGPEHSARIHGGTTPFRGEKMTTYEGGVRVPFMVRWPGHVPPGTVLTGIQAHMDVLPTLAHAAGEPNAVERILAERDQVIDGVDNLAYWTGESSESARNDFLYYYESDIKAVRMGPWKIHFATSENYYDIYQKQKFPVFFNIRMDPFESFDEVGDRSGIVQRKQWLNEPLQELLNEHIQTLIEHPPVQEATSFDFSELMRTMRAGAN